LVNMFNIVPNIRNEIKYNLIKYDEIHRIKRKIKRAYLFFSE
jgi:hypothetical protein